MQSWKLVHSRIYRFLVKMNKEKKKMSEDDALKATSKRLSELKDVYFSDAASDVESLEKSRWT